MGAYQNNGTITQKGKTTRGSVNNHSRLDAFAKGSSTSFADWSTCEPEWVLSAIHQITQLGGAIVFGLSRDAGAHSVTLMLDERRETLWFNGDADLSAAMEDVCAKLASIAVTS